MITARRMGLRGLMAKHELTLNWINFWPDDAKAHEMDNCFNDAPQIALVSG